MQVIPAKHIAQMHWYVAGIFISLFQMVTVPSPAVHHNNG